MHISMFLYVSPCFYMCMFNIPLVFLRMGLIAVLSPDQTKGTEPDFDQIVSPLSTVPPRVRLGILFLF